MAEVNQNSGHGSGKVRARKLSTKVDMTPMVDLAFLLLTFFILTATFNKAHVLDVGMPEDTHIQQPVNEKDVLNVVLSENNKLYWWIGLEPPVYLTDYSKNGIRKVFMDNASKNPKLIVLIKPKDTSRYQNMVDMMDEIGITGIERYSIVDFTDDDARVMSEVLSKSALDH